MRIVDEGWPYVRLYKYKLSVFERIALSNYIKRK